MSKEEFGRWIRIMRIRNGMNQKDLARELDLDQTTVSRLERGAQNLTRPVAATSVSTSLSRESTEVARRLDQLPTPERARALRYIRAILTQAENEAPAQHIEDQPKDAA